jgi:hypothetical protein
MPEPDKTTIRITEAIRAERQRVLGLFIGPPTRTCGEVGGLILDRPDVRGFIRSLAARAVEDILREELRP